MKKKRQTLTEQDVKAAGIKLKDLKDRITVKSKEVEPF